MAPTSSTYYGYSATSQFIKQQEIPAQPYYMVITVDPSRKPDIPYQKVDHYTR
ncbi:hypothetical protein [Hymenobacter sp. AT01-02]|uniref:hypothetical protein n=1 Tax=Hymenobacter sp. AT01-02 TaxID=1571877 RepID=UPI000AF360E9|nr:hypothetical protein [Hymenobacter sp. AT01-02]